ncbi:MAG: hypothetical protein WDO13_05505 [Verrucomicrobiota bacterium]
MATFLFACPFLRGDTSAPFPDRIPSLLKISSSHDMGSTAEVSLANGVVTYRLVTGGSHVVKEIAVRPTLEQWSAFIRQLNDAKVYQWEPVYKGPLLAMDGGFYWSVEIQFEERHFGSSGNTAYPPDGDLRNPGTKSGHAAFDLFNEAVSHLIGHDYPHSESDLP